jgi:hypothetical protein
MRCSHLLTWSILGATPQRIKLEVLVVYSGLLGYLMMKNQALHLLCMPCGSTVLCKTATHGRAEVPRADGGVCKTVCCSRLPIGLTAACVSTRVERFSAQAVFSLAECHMEMKLRHWAPDNRAKKTVLVAVERPRTEGRDEKSDIGDSRWPRRNPKSL